MSDPDCHHASADFPKWTLVFLLQAKQTLQEPIVMTFIMIHSNFDILHQLNCSCYLEQISSSLPVEVYKVCWDSYLKNSRFACCLIRLGLRRLSKKHPTPNKQRPTASLWPELETVVEQSVGKICIPAFFCILSERSCFSCHFLCNIVVMNQKPATVTPLTVICCEIFCGKKTPN